MKRLDGKLALVTGAGSGIGRATARALRDRGARLVLCDRDGARLDEVARSLGRAVVLARTVDVSDRAAYATFADEVHALGPALDVLVNNAGVAYVGRLVDTPLEEWDRVLSVNVGGVVHGCHHFVPRMVRRRAGGHVVNLSSMVGLVALPGIAAYVTSKAAVLGLSDALRTELRPHGLGVTAVCPGVIATAMSSTLDLDLGSPRLKELYARYAPGMGHAPETVARAVIDGIENDVPLVVVGAEAHALAALRRVSPRASRALGAAIARLSPGR